jgi:hypothetical protein
MLFNKIGRIIRRGLYYVQTGSSLGGLPLSLLNFATIFYYNAVANISFLNNIFTNFYLFVAFSAIFFPLFFGLLGYAFKRKTRFYQSQIEVDIDANPYQTRMFVPISVPAYEAFVELFEKFGVAPEECKKLKRILQNSGSTKYK